MYEDEGFILGNRNKDTVYQCFSDIKATFVGFCLCEEKLATLVKYNNRLLLLVFDGISTLKLLLMCVLTNGFNSLFVSPYHLGFLEKTCLWHL